MEHCREEWDSIGWSGTFKGGVRLSKEESYSLERSETLQGRVGHWREEWDSLGRMKQSRECGKVYGEVGYWRAEWDSLG